MSFTALSPVENSSFFRFQTRNGTPLFLTLKSHWDDRLTAENSDAYHHYYYFSFQIQFTVMRLQVLSIFDVKMKCKCGAHNNTSYFHLQLLPPLLAMYRQVGQIV